MSRPQIDLSHIINMDNISQYVQGFDTKHQLLLLYKRVTKQLKKKCYVLFENIHLPGLEAKQAISKINLEISLLIKTNHL